MSLGARLKRSSNSYPALTAGSANAYTGIANMFQTPAPQHYRRKVKREIGEPIRRSPTQIAHQNFMSQELRSPRLQGLSPQQRFIEANRAWAQYKLERGIRTEPPRVPKSMQQYDQELQSYGIASPGGACRSFTPPCPQACSRGKGNHCRNRTQVNLQSMQRKAGGASNQQLIPFGDTEMLHNYSRSPRRNYAYTRSPRRSPRRSYSRGY